MLQTSYSAQDSPPTQNVSSAKVKKLQAREIKTLLHWHKEKSIDHWTRLESRNKPTNIWYQGNSMEQG